MKHNSVFSIVRYDTPAFYWAVFLHALIILVLVISVSFSETPTTAEKEVKTVQAVIVDSSVVQAEMEKIQKAEARKADNEKRRLQAIENKTRREEQKRQQAIKKRKQEEQRLAELKQKRHADELKRKQEEASLEKLQKQKQAIEEQRQAEQQRLAALQKKRQQEELDRKKAKQDELDRQQRIADTEALNKKLAEEERQQFLNSSKVKNLRSQYVKIIERHVSGFWNKPLSSNKDMFCEVIITQNLTGSVLDVKTEKCQGDKAFQLSVERAVRKASPLPDPPSTADVPAADVFDRTVLFTFRATS